MFDWFRRYPKASTRLLGWTCLILVILYTIIVCAVITQDVNNDSKDRKYINERRARTGLKWMTIPILIVVSMIEAYIIATL